MADDSPTESKAAEWTASHRVGLYPEWEIEEAVNAGVRPDGVRVLADIVATVHGEGDIARERAHLIAAAPETKRQRDVLLEAVKALVVEHRVGSTPRPLWDAVDAAISACEEPDNA